VRGLSFDAPKPTVGSSGRIEPQHKHGLCLLLKVIAGVILVVFGGGLAFAAITQAGWHPLLLAGIGALALVVALLVAASSAFHRQREATGGFLLTGAILAAVVTSVVLSPGGAAYVALVPIFVAALVLLYVKRRALIGILSVSAAASVVALTMNAFWNPPTLIPNWMDLVFRAVGYLTLLVTSSLTGGRTRHPIGYGGPQNDEVEGHRQHLRGPEEAHHEQERQDSSSHSQHPPPARGNPPPHHC
jgi:hypothetical protein